MNHRSEAVFFKQRAQEVPISHITPHQFHSGIDDGLFMAEAQIIQHHHSASLLGQQMHGVRTDVTGSSRDKNGCLRATHENFRINRGRPRTVNRPEFSPIIE